MTLKTTEAETTIMWKENSTPNNGTASEVGGVALDTMVKKTQMESSMVQEPSFIEENNGFKNQRYLIIETKFVYHEIASLIIEWKPCDINTTTDGDDAWWNPGYCPGAITVACEMEYRSVCLYLNS
uniref:Uncharacterized protein n=1 Tax=Romanomermis culicivorax TaxID=13658 RepID=A0A915IPP8_ROMCU